jgi:hypothetical protein
MYLALAGNVLPEPNVNSECTYTYRCSLLETGLLSGIKAFRGEARLKESVVFTTAHFADGGRFTLKTMSAGSCCSWSRTSRAARGLRWSTSCRGHDVAFEPVSVTPWSASAPHAYGRDTGKHRASRWSSARGAAHVLEPAVNGRWAPPLDFVYIVNEVLEPTVNGR